MARGPSPSVSIRPSTAQDAEVVAELAAEFGDYLRALGDRHPGQITEAQYRADASGPEPALSGLIGALGGEPVGYLLYCHGYDLDLGGRMLWVVDLFVRESARQQGVGRALMQAAAERCRAAGGTHLAWTLYARNRLGRRFYQGLGAKSFEDLEFMHWRVADG